MEGEAALPTRQLLKDREAADWLSIGTRKLWSLRASGQIKHVKIGRAIRFDIDDLRAFVAANKEGAAE